ncbi:hypothetical protein NP493_1128g00032 [Ridgeia piscesae]|uniref:Ankyrin repeat-containing protein n=1 Tax=Ridgeia piscesae TaxID=27915 RepID=A0AAD9NKW1_RIDPI|nr:hypothetical protein NP493_1128g00032 [Ridgeia piscesae]
MCELILAQQTYTNRRVRLAKSDIFYQRYSGKVRVTSNTTPIMLAAVRNNFAVMKLLVAAGATISIPHDYFCEMNR